ncbi:hypothetical protein QQG55_47255 [Brugia pahangi]|uniref:Beta-galactosidase n=1 Tax=Brugia pahangi TaxID=6280 RepID=A0A0N4SWJ4_BRUPA|nr:unnamed protein product [Brugia pahangi]
MTVRIKVENGFERITVDNNMYARQFRNTQHPVSGSIAVDGAAGEKNWSTGALRCIEARLTNQYCTSAAQRERRECRDASDARVEMRESC